MILSAALGHLFDGKPAGSDAWIGPPLGPGRGVRDLAAFDKGILILAGPMQDVGGTYSGHRWDGASSSAKLLADLPDFISEKGKQWEARSAATPRS